MGERGHGERDDNHGNRIALHASVDSVFSWIRTR